MAESLLKSWQAPSLVTSVAIDAGAKPTAEAANTAVTDLTRAKGKTTAKISWTQADKALPLPFPPSEVIPYSRWCLSTPISSLRLTRKR